MALSLVSASTEVKWQGNVSPITMSARTHTPGNLLVLLLAVQVSSVPSVSNTAGDTWHQAVSQFNGGLNYLSIYYAYNIAGNASDVVSISNFGGSGYNTFALFEIQSSNGAFAADPGDPTGTNFSTGNIGLSTPTLTITGAQDIILAIVEHDSANLVAGTGYTLTTDVGGGGSGFEGVEYHIVTASEAASFSTTGGTAGGIIAAASFKDVPGGGGLTAAQQIGIFDQQLSVGEIGRIDA